MCNRMNSFYVFQVCNWTTQVPDVFIWICSQWLSDMLGPDLIWTHCYTMLFL